MQLTQRFVADQRFDLPQYEAMIDFISAEFDAYNKAVFVADNKILKNWKILNAGGLTAQVDQSSDSALFNTNRTGKEEFILRDASATALTIDLADNATNYVEVQIYSTTCAPDTVALWDATANANEGTEYTQTVNTNSTEAARLVSNTIGFTGSPDKIALAIVTTSGGVITNIEDARSLFYRSQLWNFGVTRSDANIFTIKNFYDAITTALGEVKGFTGTNWFDKPWTDFKLLREYQNMFISGGGNIAWEGVAGSNNLQWTADIKIEIAGRSSAYVVAPSTQTLADGQCIYVDIPAGSPVDNLTPVISALTAVPVDPSVSGQSARIMVLFFRRGNTIFGLMDIPELDSGEVAEIGQDLPQDIRARLAILSESSYKAYTSTGVIAVDDDYADALSKLDAKMGTILAFIVAGSPDPANHGYTSTAGANLLQTDDLNTAISKLDYAIANLPSGGGGGGGAGSIIQEYLSGVVNGVNNNFTISHVPADSSSIVVVVGDLIQPPSEWSLSGNTIILATAPKLDQLVYAYYATDAITMHREVVAGADGSTDTFALAATPPSAASMFVAVDGLILKSTQWSLVSGSSIQFAAGSIPARAQDIFVVWFVDDHADQETPTGTIDGTNDTFTISGAPTNAQSMVVFMDGRVLPYNTWSLFGTQVRFAAGYIPKLGQDIYTFYYTGALGVGGGSSVGTTPNVMNYTLTSTDITNKYITLTATPYVANKTILDIPSLGNQGVYGVDFTVSAAQLSWSGLDLDGLLIDGDILRILFFT